MPRHRRDGLGSVVQHPPMRATVGASNKALMGRSNLNFLEHPRLTRDAEEKGRGEKGTGTFILTESAALR